MPGGGQPIVIGGGIQLTGGAIDEFLVLTSINPPVATSSRRIRRAANTIIMESAAGRTNTVIGPNATSAATVNEPEILIGSNISSLLGGAPGANIGIGVNIGFTGTSTFNTLIGNMTAGLFPVGGITGGGCTIIGRVNSLGAAFRNSVTVVGAFTTISGHNVVAIGESVSANGANCVAIGQASSAGTSNVTVGQAASSAAVRCIVIGNASAAPNADKIAIGHSLGNAGGATQILIGNGIDPNQVGAGEICFGHNGLGGGGFSVGVRWGQNQHATGVPCPAWTETHKSALGTNIAAGDVTYILPKATGNAVAGAWIIQTATPGASGATLQTAAEVARFSPGTATQPRNFQITIDKGLWFTNQTSGAGAGLGTLTNAPTAGDPNHWLRTRINGVDHFIPCWI